MVLSRIIFINRLLTMYKIERDKVREKVREKI